METGYGKLGKGDKWSPQSLEILSTHERMLYDEYVNHHEYRCHNKKTTVAVLVLNNNFEVVGTSGCEDPRRFDEQLGHLYALKDALKKVGEFAAFHRAQKKFEGAHPATVTLNFDKATPEFIERLRQAMNAPTSNIGVTVIGNAKTDATTINSLGYSADSINSITESVFDKDAIGSSHRIR